MAQGRAYTEADLESIPKIRPDGSVESADVISLEQAEAIDKTLSGLPEVKPIELEEELTAVAKVIEAKPEAAKPADNPETGITLDKTDQKAKDDEIIRVGGEELKKSDLLKEASEYADVDLTGASEKTKAAIIEMYVTKKHDDAWKKNNTQKAEENARVRKENERAKADIEHRRRTLTNQQKMLKEQHDKLKVLAAKEMTEDDIFDDSNRVSISKQREFNKIMDAREKLPEIQEQLENTQREVAQTEIDRTLADVEALIAVHPEYQFEGSQSLREAMKRFEDGNKNDADADKILDIYAVIDKARDYGISIDKAFERLSRTSALTVAATKPIIPETKKTTEAERVAKTIADKQKGAQFIDPATAAGERTQQNQKVTLGDKMRDAALRARGLTSNPILEKSGY